MRATIGLIDSQQTIALLTKHLGTDVAWASFLADIRRTPRPGKNAPDLHGHQLEPYAVSGSQPLYHHRDVMAFVAAVKAADPSCGLKVRSYVVDDTPGLPWSWREAELVATRRPSALTAP